MTKWDSLTIVWAPLMLGILRDVLLVAVAVRYLNLIDRGEKRLKSLSARFSRVFSKAQKETLPKQQDK